MSHSPVPRNVPIAGPGTRTMTWADAQQALIDGKAIIRLSWTEPSTYIRVKDDLLKIFRNHQWHHLDVHINDMTATDWMCADLEGLPA